MKSYFFITRHLLVSAILLASLSSAFAMDEPEFTINRMLMSKDISDREPVNTADTFSSTTEKVYCFLEVKDVEVDTRISFAWYYEGQEKARVTLPLNKGERWRTFSSKIVKNMQGSWKVELVDASGVILNSVSFQLK